MFIQMKFDNDMPLDVDRIEIEYHLNDEDKELFPTFCEMYKDNTIVVDCGRGAFDVIYSFIECVKKNKITNIELIHDGFDDEIVNECKRVGIKLQFPYEVSSWGLLHKLLEAGYSSVIVGNDLGFDLPTVKKVCDEYGVKVMVLPFSEFTKELTDFFIRPEDLEMYSKYIDGIIFEDTTHYDIYCKDKEWYNLLNTLIPSLKTEIDNRSVYREFAKRRVNCGRTCYKGSKCKLCNEIAALSMILGDNGLLLVQERKEKKNGGKGLESEKADN